MFKLVVLAALLAIAAAKPGVVAPLAYSAYAPGYSTVAAPVAYSSYAAPLAYSTPVVKSAVAPLAYTAPVASTAYSTYSGVVNTGLPYAYSGAYTGYPGYYGSPLAYSVY